VASPNALYVIEGGGNDARAALAAIAGGAQPGPTILSTALSFAANIGTIVNELKLAGAQHIVVWDTPNLGLSPAVAAAGPAAAGLGSFLAASMNQLSPHNWPAKSASRPSTSSVWARRLHSIRPHLDLPT
jgi:outer membrane lipase/esterase